MVTLGDVATVDRQIISPVDIDDGTPYLGLEHIERGGRLLGFETIGSFTVASAKHKFTGEHILYGKLRPNLGKVSRPDFNGICSTDILPIRIGDNLDRNYLFHYLSQPQMVDHAASKTSGANLPRLSPKELLKFPVPLPSLDEQCRIAAILDRAAALKSTRESARKLADSVTATVFSSQFGDYPAMTLVEDIAAPNKGSIRTGPFGSQLLHNEFVNEGVGVLGLDNVVSDVFTPGSNRHITEEKFAQLKKYQVFPGDVLISIMGTVGRCAIVPESIPTTINTKHICAITVNHELITPTFLRAAFLWHSESRRHLIRQTKGSIMNGLNMGIIKSMPIPVPPIGTQYAFDRKCAKAQQELARQNCSLLKLEDMLTSLRSRAFRGEL